MKRLLNILTWVSLVLAAASFVLWLWPELNFSFGHSGTPSRYTYWQFDHGWIYQMHMSSDCGYGGFAVPIWIAAALFALLPAIRFLTRVFRSKTAAGLPIELSH